MARYAVGDIHGCLKTLVHLIEQKIKLSKEDRIFFLGDYIDRGPDSKGVLDYLMQLKSDGYQTYAIRGNHEEMLLNSLEHPSQYATWTLNGAAESLKSFGISNWYELGPDCVTLIPEQYIRFCKSCSYFLNLEPDYIFVHAGINIHAQEPFKDTKSMLWMRSELYDAKLLGNKKLVHGHNPRPVQEMYFNLKKQEKNTINLDAGCVYSQYDSLGNLVGLNLDDLTLHAVKNMDC